MRVTTSVAMSGFLVKQLGPLRERHPNLVVEVLAGNELFDLSRGQADLAIRFAQTTQPELIVRKLATVDWALFAAEGYLAGRAPLASIHELAGWDVIGYDESLRYTPGGQWLSEHDGQANTVLRCNSIVSALNAALAGLGLAAVPCFVCAAEPTLHRVAAEPIGSRDVFLVYHPDVARAARVRAVLDFMIDTVAKVLG